MPVYRSRVGASTSLGAQCDGSLDPPSCLAWRVQPSYTAYNSQEHSLDRDAQGHVVRKAGVMGVVLAGSEVRPTDPVRVELPPEPHQPLAPV